MVDPTSMTTLTLSAVPAEEAAPFYEDFLAAFPDGRVGIHLQAQVVELEELCAGLTESGAMFRYNEGKWTIKEVIGHLLDTERVFAYRLLYGRCGEGMHVIDRRSHSIVRLQSCFRRAHATA